jgi:hypothetical protein
MRRARAIRQQEYVFLKSGLKFTKKFTLLKAFYECIYSSEINGAINRMFMNYVTNYQIFKITHNELLEYFRNTSNAATSMYFSVLYQTCKWILLCII